MTLLAALAVAILPAPAAATEAPPYWTRIDNCHHGHRAEVALPALTRLLRNHRPISPGRFERALHLRRCVTTRPARLRTARRARVLRAWRRSYAHRWPIAFNRLAPWERSWARSTSACESGHNPRAYSGAGPYFGAFQWLLSTWRIAGGTGNPVDHSWAYQAVIAVRLMRREGAGHWPRCG